VYEVAVWVASFFCVCLSDLPDFPIIPSRQHAVRRSEVCSVVGLINHTHGKRGALIRAVAGRHGDFPTQYGTGCSSASSDTVTEGER
jgi:hypothetical protein